jgi:biofilm PGA synthesis N-glycosyltransferase PgaC
LFQCLFFLPEASITFTLGPKLIMLFWKYVFWISCFIIFYNYAGYAILVYLFNRFKRRKKLAPPEGFSPSISFIVAAFNEEECIDKKIINSLQQVYPSDKIEFIFITDGSTDTTPDVVKAYPLIKLLHSEERLGKSAALNRAVLHAKNEILIFSDANTVLNKEACLNISKHYFDNKVGGVAGEKKVVAIENDNQNPANSEGLYWKYESSLKKLDSDFHSVVGAAGELFSIRRSLFESVSPDVILDDFVISMKIAQQGYQIVYEPDAFAMELPSMSIDDEKKRKVRIAAGGFQAMTMLPEALLPWKNFKLSFLYISHRALRWTLTPICLVLAFISNLILVYSSASPVYTTALLLQATFYLSGFAYKLLPTVRKVSILKLPYYFIFMNISVFQGFAKFLGKKQSAAWEKAKRSTYNQPEANGL